MSWVISIRAIVAMEYWRRRCEGTRVTATRVPSVPLPTSCLSARLRQSTLSPLRASFVAPRSVLVSGMGVLFGMAVTVIGSVLLDGGNRGGSFLFRPIAADARQSRHH